MEYLTLNRESNKATSRNRCRQGARLAAELRPLLTATAPQDRAPRTTPEDIFHMVHPASESREMLELPFHVEVPFVTLL